MTAAAPERPGGARRWARLLGRALDAFDLLFPAACVGCGAGVPPGPPICHPCRSRLPAVDPPRCPRCGATRIAGFAAPGRCAECEGWPETLVRAAAPWRLEGVAERAVHALKYGGWTALAPYMGASMEGAARRIAGARDPLLVPVPLPGSRRRERGFNQAEALARGLAAVTGWPVADLLGRRRAARQQARLARPGREENVRDLFAVLPAAASRALDLRRPVLLVDDVLTTGATAAGCAAAILAAGFDFTGVISFARALRRIEAERGDRPAVRRPKR